MSAHKAKTDVHILFSNHLVGSRNFPVLFSSEINLVSQQTEGCCLYHSSTMPSSSPQSSDKRSGLAQSFRFMLPHIALVIIYLLYIALGGVLFSGLEAPMYAKLSEEEHAKITEAQHTKQIIMEAYHNASMGTVKLEDGNITALLDSLIDTVNHPDWKAGRQKTLMMGRDWSFPSAMLFAMTTITTIGYGDLVPETVEGKVVCVIYSAIGIPYSFFLLADIGQLLALGFIRLIRCLKHCRNSKKREKNLANKNDVYDKQSAQPPRLRQKKKHKTKRFRGPMPNVTMRHLQSLRFSVDPDATPERRSTFKTVGREGNDKVIGMTVIGTGHDDIPSPNTNNSGLDQSCPTTCNETPHTSVTVVTTTFDEKKEPVQTKEVPMEAEKDDYESNDEDYPADEVSFTLVLCTLCSYICISAFAFTLVENWDYGTAFYFTFITLTTVGFGDVVPEEQYHPWRFFFCLLFTVFGLAVTSMCIALVQDRVSRAGRRLLGYLESRSGSKDIEEQKDFIATSRDARCKEG